MNQFKNILLVLVLLASCQLQAQQDTIRNLVFEGAGIRGIAYSGVVNELEKRNLVRYVQRVGGTSAGAITALMLALGYSASEITNIISSTSFNKLNDGKFSFIGGINRLRNYFGWYKGKRFENWIAKIIEAKTNNPDITFQQLHEQGYKDLYVTGTSLTSQELIVFSREFYPQMKVKDAVKISVSIPLYFQAVFVDKEGNIKYQPKDKTGLEIMVDGGFTGNYPIRIFDSSKYLGNQDTNTFMNNPQTLGFRVDREEQIPNNGTGKGLAPIPIRNFNEYMQAFYNIIVENLNRQSLTKEDWNRTVSISDAGIQPRIRKLTPAEIKALTISGEKAILNHFSPTQK